MATKNFMAKLLKLDGAITSTTNPFDTVIGTFSPSVNFTYGNTWGLPRGYSQVLFGAPKAGKTVMANSLIGGLHRDYPNAYAIKYDTEYRENGQLTPQMAAIYGIDRERYVCYAVNSPDLIFDKIENDIPALCQEGMDLGLIVIDSITGIQGRRAMNADSIMTQQIGDLALTLQEGFKRILPVQRKYGFSVILTAQIRAEMDALEQRRGNKVKMAVPFAVQHYSEFWTYIEELRNKDTKTDLNGNAFENKNLKDSDGNVEKTGHKIRVTMKNASMGPKGRVGVFTLDYKHGIINVHEEVFTLGVNRRVIVRPNNKVYAFGDRQWNGKPAMLEALKSDTDLQKAVLTELRRRDLPGYLDTDVDAGMDLEDIVDEE